MFLGLAKRIRSVYFSIAICMLRMINVLRLFLVVLLSGGGGPIGPNVVRQLVSSSITLVQNRFMFCNTFYTTYIFRSHLQSMSGSVSLPLPLAGNETGAQNASSSTFCLDLLLPAALNVTSWSQMNQVTKCSIYYKTFHDKIFYLFVLN